MPRARQPRGAYYSQRMYKEAVEHQKSQLAIAMKMKDRKTSATALSSLGHTYVSVADYSNALASHKQACQIYKELRDNKLKPENSAISAQCTCCCLIMTTPSNATKTT